MYKRQVFIPICLLTCSALGANPTGLVLLVRAGSMTAFLTPMATPAVPICMADGGYDLKSLFKSGALITLILPFIYIFYTCLLYTSHAAHGQDQNGKGGHLHTAAGGTGSRADELQNAHQQLSDGPARCV